MIGLVTPALRDLCELFSAAGENLLNARPYLDQPHGILFRKAAAECAKLLERDATREELDAQLESVRELRARSRKLVEATDASSPPDRRLAKPLDAVARLSLQFTDSAC